MERYLPNYFAGIENDLLCQSEDEASKSDLELAESVPKTEMKINDAKEIFETDTNPSISVLKKVSSDVDQKFLDTAEAIPTQLPRTNQIETQLFSFPWNFGTVDLF